MPNGRSHRGYVIRSGEYSSPVRPARLSADLTTTAYVQEGIADPRLVDPHLEAVVEQAAMEARARGFRAGHSAGYEAGRQEGLALIEEQRRLMTERDEVDRQRQEIYLDALVDNVRARVLQAVKVHSPTLTEMYDLIASMTVELAESLVGHHLEIDGCGAKDALLRALDQAPRGARLTIRVHPDDFDLVEGFTRGVTEWEVTKLVADPGVEKCGAVVEAENLEIDAQYGPAFERVRKVIRP